MENEKTIYLVRHCQDEPSDDMEQVEAAEVSLTADGVRQADALARYMRSKGVEAVYTSIFRRSKQTAEIIHARTGGQFIIDERLNEQVLTRARLDSKTAKEIKRRMLEDLDYVPEAGQSLQKSIELFLTALEDIARSPHQRICVISHGFLMQAALQRRFNLVKAPQLVEGSITVIKRHINGLSLKKTNAQPFLLLRIRQKLARTFDTWRSRLMRS